MFESEGRLREDVQGLLEAVRGVAHGQWACVMEPGKILFETETDSREVDTLRPVLEACAAAIFALPGAMEREGPDADPFEDWHHDDLLLAFVNSRVAVVVACPDAEASSEAITKPLRALVDRLLRLNSRYRLDPRGRGLFLGKPRLDVVTLVRARE